MAIDKVYNVTKTDGVAGVVKYGSVFNVPKGTTPPEAEAIGAFSTLDTFEKTSTITLSNGNLTYSASSNYTRVFSTAGWTTGKREYWFYNDNELRPMVGIGLLNAMSNKTSWPASDSYGMAIWMSGGQIYHAGDIGQPLGNVPDQSWVGIRHDADTGEVWFKREADGSWTLSNNGLPTGTEYRALLGTGTAGAANTSNVVFDPDGFPETIGDGFEPIREPTPSTYDTINPLDRFDDNIQFGADWDTWTHRTSRSCHCHTPLSSGKYEFWAKRQTGGGAAYMVGWGTDSTSRGSYPGVDTYSVGFWFSDGTMWSNSSKVGNPVLGALGFETYIGCRIDIDGQTVEYNKNGAGWNTQANVHSNFWLEDIRIAVGADGATSDFSPSDMSVLITDPALFPQTISSGYSGVLAS